MHRIGYDVFLCILALAILLVIINITYNLKLDEGIFIIIINSSFTNFAFMRKLGFDPLPNSHLCEIHMGTCSNCNGDISFHASLKIVNQNSQ